MAAREVLSVRIARPPREHPGLRAATNGQLIAAYVTVHLDAKLIGM